MRAAVALASASEVMQQELSRIEFHRGGRIAKGGGGDPKKGRSSRKRLLPDTITDAHMGD